MITILHDHENRPVRLTPERWAHILDHPEMIGMEAAVAQTLRGPQLVVRSRSDPHAALCYRFYRKTILEDKWLCVVVKYGAKDAFVLTAYLTDKPKAGEQLWPKP
jgi:hypothetical protein